MEIRKGHKRSTVSLILYYRGGKRLGWTQPRFDYPVWSGLFIVSNDGLNLIQVEQLTMPLAPPSFLSLFAHEMCKISLVIIFYLTMKEYSVLEKRGIWAGWKHRPKAMLKATEGDCHAFYL